jgi:hypothetical protein
LSSIVKDLEVLVERAMKHPGVADVERVYGQYRDVLAVTEAYLGALDVEPSFSVTDSTSR